LIEEITAKNKASEKNTTENDIQESEDSIVGFMNIVAMFNIFVIIFKSKAGIMGWRRQLMFSTLLAFLITLLVFELGEQFEEMNQWTGQGENEEGKESKGLLKTISEISEELVQVTMWFWPEFLISTLEGMAEEYEPNFS